MLLWWLAESRFVSFVHPSYPLIFLVCFFIHALSAVIFLYTEGAFSGPLCLIFEKGAKYHGTILELSRC